MRSPPRTSGRWPRGWRHEAARACAERRARRARRRRRGSLRHAGPRSPARRAQGVHITPLSNGTIGASVHANAAGIEITTHGRKDMLVTAITVDPGGTFGWHSHPGPVLVAVSKGTLTVYDATKHGCRRSTVTAGDAFVEDGHHVHLARNEGAVPVELNATFLARARHDRVPEDGAAASRAARPELSRPRRSARPRRPPPRRHGRRRGAGRRARGSRSA